MSVSGMESDPKAARKGSLVELEKERGNAWGSGGHRCGRTAGRDSRLVTGPGNTLRTGTRTRTFRCAHEADHVS